MLRGSYGETEVMDFGLSHNLSARFLLLISCHPECHPTIRQRGSVHQYIQAPTKIVLF